MKTSQKMAQDNMTDPEETENVKGISPFVLGLLDLFLLNLAFFSLNYWKRGTLDLSPIYVKLLFAFYGLWFVVSLSTKKFRSSEYQGLTKGIWTLVRSGIYLAYCMAAMVVLLGLYAYSRGHIFGTCLALMGFECSLFSAVHFLFLRRRAGDSKRQGLLGLRPPGISWGLLCVDFVLVTEKKGGQSLSK